MTGSNSGRTIVTLQAGGTPETPRLEIDAATLEAWNRRYALEIGLAPTDEAELALLDELERRGRAGYCWTETGDDLEVGQMEWDRPSVQRAAGLKVGGTQAAGNPWLFWALVFGILLFFWGGVFWLFSYTNGRHRSGLPAETPSEAVTASVPAPTPTPPPPATPAVVVGAERLPLEPPHTLKLVRLNQTLTVVTGQVSAGRPVWPALTDSTQVVWLPSPINWCLGMDESWLKQLQAGDVLTVQMASGRPLQFVVEAFPIIRRDRLEVLAQARVGLTLLPLAAAGDTLQAVTARYDPTLEQPQTVAAAPVQPGTVITVGTALLSLQPLELAAQSDGTYAVIVSGVITGSSGDLTPALQVAGQLYAARQALPSDGGFRLSFVVPRLAPAQLWLGADRLELGPLRAPTLHAQLISAGITPQNTLRVELVLTALNGAQLLREGAFTLVLPAKGGEAAQAMAPLEAPPLLQVKPGQPQTVTVIFARPAPEIKTVRLQTPAEAWDLALP